MTTVPLPKIYWDIFQAALQSKVRRLAKDLATCLGEPEQPLLNALAAEKTAVYLFEEEGSEYIDVKSMRCKHYIPSPDNEAVLTPCHRPVLLGRPACIYHEGTRQQIHPSLLELRQITDETGTIYWLDKENTIRNKSDPSLCQGFYDEQEGTLRIFTTSP
jgi:hypothetical protein